MKVSKHLLAVIAMAGTMGFSAVASAMDFSVYGSLRGGLNQVDNDDTQQAGGLRVVGDNLTVTGSELEAGAFTANAGAKAVTVGGVDYVPGTHVAGGVTEAADAQLELGHGFAGSRIGIRGSEDLGNGAEAGLHWESAVGGKGDLAENGRHANVWYSGAFGKVTIGQQGNPYRNAANWDQSWWLGGVNRPNGNFGGDGGSRLQGIRYDGGSGAFNFSVMATAQNDTSNAAGADDFTITTDVAATGDDLGADNCDDKTSTAVGTTEACVSGSTISYEEVEAETGIDSWIATGHYDMGVATINLGYRVNNNEAQQVGKSWDNFVISANGTLDALSWYIAFDSSTDNTNVKREDWFLTADEVAGGADADEDAARALSNDSVEKVADSLATAHDSTTIGLFLGYSLSDVSTLYLEWENTANDGLDVLGENLDQTATLLGFSRKIGPNTSFIAEYSSVDRNSELAQDYTQLQGYLKVDF